MSKLRVLDLFSGIGGFSLGLERTGGFETVAFCEIEPFPRRVLAKHWPKVPCYDDVRTLTADRLAADGISVDVICGGFPCQDISIAGAGAGLEGARSGLWSEIKRLVGELRPRIVYVENVAALLGRGLDRVLGDLAELRYDVQWDVIPASALGARHQRRRVWIVAYRHDGQRDGQVSPIRSGRYAACLIREALANADRMREPQPQGGEQDERGRLGHRCENVADTIGIGQPGSRQYGNACNSAAPGQGQATDAVNGCIGDIWSTEPDVGRVAHGVPSRVDRLKSLGNAVVPQIPELIGNAILASLRQSEAA
jgi:DNA (cytosine-5)-methyltransferase 1